MSYNLNKLVKLSSLQQLLEKIKNIFATKEEVSQISTIPPYDGLTFKDKFLKVNNNNELEWSNSLSELIKLDVLQLEKDYSEIQEKTSIVITPDGTPMNPIILLETDSQSKVILRGLATPIANFDAVNKEYVDNKTPLYITLSGTTENNNATCDTSWEDIRNAITQNKHIIMKYISPMTKTYFLNVSYSEWTVNGDFIEFNNFENPEDYIQIKIIIEANSLAIEYIDNA